MKIKEALSILSSLESRLLLSHVTTFSHEYLISHCDDTLSDEMQQKFLELTDLRIQGYPIAYLTQNKEFYSRDFFINNNVLIPRPDSETIIDAALELTHKTNPNILELGVGSGCLLITLLLEFKNAYGDGIDISSKALEIAQINAEKFALGNRIKLYQSDWFDKVDGKYDLIISNPPYISLSEKDLMSSETINFEPHIALFGDVENYQIIASGSKKFLNPKGHVIVEIGYNQYDIIYKIFQQEGYRLVKKYHDIEKRDRVMVLTLD